MEKKYLSATGPSWLRPKKLQSTQTVAHARNSLESKRQSNTGYATCNAIEAGAGVQFVETGVQPHTQLPRRALAPARAIVCYEGEVVSDTPE